MLRSCRCCMNKTVFISMTLCAWAASLCVSGAVFAVERQRDPVTLRVVTVNPAVDKTQEIPVRIDLPAEVTPKDVLDSGELRVEYDEDKKSYYVFKEKVSLAPKEARVFEVIVKDLWFVPQDKLDGLRNYTRLVMGRLEKTEYVESAKKITDSILVRLDDIETTQNDESISRKTRIGNFRYHTRTLGEIKEDLARLEKLLSFTGGPPVPEMLKESKLKSDAPSNTTTWLVIFMILVFLGLLGGQFFFTWNRRITASRDAGAVKEAAFEILRKDDLSANELGRTSATQVEGSNGGSPAGKVFPGLKSGPGSGSGTRTGL